MTSNIENKSIDTENPTDNQVIDENEKVDVELLMYEKETMQSVIIDLTRRLKNSEHTIEAQKHQINISNYQSEAYRKRISDMSLVYKLEITKTSSLERKQTQQIESKNFEDRKAKNIKLHQDLRMAIIDQQATGSKLKLVTVNNLKDKIKKFTTELDSQKTMLNYLVEYNKLTEALCNAAQFANLDDCIKLIKRGVSINEVDTASYLPLHYAISNGSIECVRLFLEFGSDPTSYLTGDIVILK